jgi:hypothetical protein
LKTLLLLRSQGAAVSNLLKVTVNSKIFTLKKQLTLDDKIGNSIVAETLQ